MYCPLCEDPTTSNSPSASYNVDKGQWRCFSCQRGGSVAALLRALGKGTRTDKAADNVVDITSRQARTRIEPISEARILGYMEELRGRPDLLAYMMEDRGLARATLDRFKVGYDHQRDRYTFPVYDETDTLVNIRRYDATANAKMINAAGHGSPARLYPLSNLKNGAAEVWVCEGEMDALLNTQNGFPTVTGTHGAATWLPEWSKHFHERTAFICFDNDKEGRLGARRVAKALLPTATAVWTVQVPVETEHGDLTDFWVSGGTRAQLRRAQGKATQAQARHAEEEATSQPMPVEVQVIGSMDARTNGKPLIMQVSITGKKNPAYTVPHKARLLCTMDAGPKCKLCPMFGDHEGEVEVTIHPQEVSTLARFIDATDAQTTELLRKHIGAVKCNRFETEEVTNQTVEEIFVTGSIDRRNGDSEADYTQRRIYNVGAHDTKTNTVASVVGTTLPNPKDRRNEFFSWQLQEAVTSIDKFEMTGDMHERLKVFQPQGKQRPIDKCREIAKDLGDNVTRIFGRERLHMAMDLVWHSALHFPLDDKVISRGWLEFLVVGDTRTGKSETAQHLAEHYGLGHIVGCEGATFAGLVGAVKQVSNAWTIQWGEITINDRRLVVLDETSGLSQEIISQLSDIRSRGVAQLTKAETAQTLARVRLIWISNPRKGRFVDEKKYDGIDVIEDLIGNPEDIARFDFAMSVSQADVPNEHINTPNRPKVPHVHTSDLCRDLILWAWSRKAEHVEWKTDAYRGVYKAAEWLGKKYIDSPPLIQRTNVREKVARLSVALAIRTFSTDATGEHVVVTLDHVKDAMYFLDELYTYDNFGYLRLSQRVLKNRKTARRNRADIRKFLLENPRLLDFLIDRRGSFRAQDLEEMAHMQRDDVNFCLSRLTDAKMISKAKSQIILEPELHDLLREMEDR